MTFLRALFLYIFCVSVSVAQPFIPAGTVQGNANAFAAPPSPLTTLPSGLTYPTPTQTGVTTAVQTIGTYPLTYGTFAQATGCSQVTNSTHAPQVMGISPSSAISGYNSFDSVSCYFDNTAPPLIANVAGTFTTTTFVPNTALSSGVVSQLEIGMWIKTSDATYYAGQITGWAINGTSITVSGWYQQGNAAAGQIPSGPNALINPVAKIWAINANAILTNTSYATASAGFEMGLIDNSPSAATNASWGFDSVNLTANVGQYAFIARGLWSAGFNANNSTGTGFLFSGSTGNTFPGFESQQTSGRAFVAIPNGNINYSVDAATGGLDIGGQTLITSPYVNFHTSAVSLSYDSEIVPSGGNGSTVGGGTLNYLATIHNFYGATNATSYMTLGASAITFGNATGNQSFTFNGTGVATFNGGMSVAGNINAARFTATATTVSVNGMYLSATNTLGLSANSTKEASFSTSAITIGEATNNPSYSFPSTSAAVFGGEVASPYVAVSGSGTHGTPGIYEPNAGVLGIYDGTAQAANFSHTTASLPGAITLPGLAASSAATTGTACWTTGTGNITVDTTLACLASLKEWKQHIADLNIGLNELMKLHPVGYELKPEYDPFGAGAQIGFLAEEVETIDKRLVGYGGDGKLRGVRYMQMTALITAAVQELTAKVRHQQLEIYALMLWSSILTAIMVFHHKKPT
jgi:hypothetical protein